MIMTRHVQEQVTIVTLLGICFHTLLCERSPVIVDSKPMLSQTPGDAESQQHRLEHARANIGNERGKVDARFERQRVYKQGTPRHLQAHHGDAETAHELCAGRVHNLR